MVDYARVFSKRKLIHPTILYNSLAWVRRLTLSACLPLSRRVAHSFHIGVGFADGGL